MTGQDLQDISNTAGINLPFTNLGGAITTALPYLFGIAGIILILNIIVSGYQMMTSAGEPKIMQAAKSKLTASIIGIFIIFISFWLVNLILNFFGIVDVTIIK